MNARVCVRKVEKQKLWAIKFTTESQSEREAFAFILVKS